MTPKRQARLFIAALCITLIVIAMVLGFMVVDLGSERYMPGLLDPIYMVGGLGEQGVYFYWMGQAYKIYSGQVMQAGADFWPLRGLLPPSIRLAGGLAVALSGSEN